jgi:hypothetical protein
VTESFVSLLTNSRPPSGSRSTKFD